jgi:hypothetical protein
MSAISLFYYLVFKIVRLLFMLLQSAENKPKRVGERKTAG